MYNIFFYEDKDGNRPVLDYLKKLEANPSKNNRINAGKIRDYVKILSAKGTRAGEKYVKHLDGDIWELRPLSNRIMFAAWYKNSFILLHHFVKKQQKTPIREIEKAKRELKDIIERWSQE